MLAIAAARLGWDPVVALDNDPASVAATAENAARNRVELRVERFDLRRAAPPPAGTVAANLLGPLLRELAAAIDAAPDRLIASGLLVSEADGLAAAFAARGVRELERRESGEWAALLLGA